MSELKPCPFGADHGLSLDESMTVEEFITLTQWSAPKTYALMKEIYLQAECEA